MIVDAAEAYLISHIGHVDGSALWRCETRSAKVDTIRVGDAGRLSIYPGIGDVFAIVHHIDRSRLRILARRVASPDIAVAHVDFIDGNPTFDGEDHIWTTLPRAYLGSHGDDAGDPALILLDRDRRSVDVQALTWFSESYDRTYQSILAVREIPGEDLLVLTVQRSSHLVVYDPKTQVRLRVPLAARRGNPMIFFRSRAPELWASDYDTLLRLNPRGWAVRNRKRLQGLAVGGRMLVTRAFIGQFAFNNDESLCAVARPFKGDVVALDTEGFEVTHRAVVGRQPLDVALLSDGRVFARDWKTGDLLRGTLKRRVLRM